MSTFRLLSRSHHNATESQTIDSYHYHIVSKLISKISTSPIIGKVVESYAHGKLTDVIEYAICVGRNQRKLL